MKIIYFDCSFGVTGEMLLGSLLDLGCDIHSLATELNKIKLGIEYEITVSKTTRCSVSSSLFEITAEKSYKKIGAEDILKAISESTLASEVKKFSLSALLRIFNAKNTIMPNEEGLYFPLRDALKMIVTTIGFAHFLSTLSYDAVIFSPIAEGTGFVNIDGTLYSIPEPIAFEILREEKIEINVLDVPYELITPDGASIVCEAKDSISLLPSIVIKQVGYGASHINSDEIPSLLRVIIGETKDELNLDTNTYFNMTVDSLFNENYGYNMNTDFNKMKEV